MDDLYIEQRLKIGSFLSEKNKYIYIENPKAACTYIKTLLLEIEREILHKENPEYPSRERKNSLLVHDRGLNPMKFIESVSHLESLLNSGTYYIFSAVRHPINRLFSAWASKIFSHEGDVYYRLRNSPGYCENRYAENVDIKTGFDSFVRFLSEKEFPHFSNHHWQEQNKILMIDRIKYNDITKTDNLADFINGFLIKMNMDVNEIKTKRENESILTYHHDYISDYAEDLIIKMYKSDFEIFHYEKEKPKTVSSPLFVKHLVDEIIAKNDRIHTLLDYFSN